MLPDDLEAGTSVGLPVENLQDRKLETHSRLSRCHFTVALYVSGGRCGSHDGSAETGYRPYRRALDWTCLRNPINVPPHGHSTRISARLYRMSAELPAQSDDGQKKQESNSRRSDHGSHELRPAGGRIGQVCEKREETEKKKDYYVSERRYGTFERYFTLPEGVNADKIEATFKNGVLKVVLPKTEEAPKPAKTINVKAA
ncbi:Hsp20/alpha crystallin family protein [Bradyrhizobium symbiodeficiens]|uniref:Hsp20/alpha crystallin family protein n=1 Tax=Bradyrhizobium symbiodeficiens TaxID=1404367 RepID=A0ABZ2F2F2_9BRAD|nr:Hsp20/alpha crystallin family protein [Bradyrhizobium symbiodeficiens]